MPASQETNASRILRCVIIGVGGVIGPSHIKALKQMPEAELVAVADIDAARAQARAQEIGCPWYTDHRAMLAEHKPDVAVITTPHPFHAPLAVDAFAFGAHVLVEKPLAVHVGAADQMIQAADQAGRLLVVNFQQRFRPVIERAKALMESGAIGPIVRTLCIEPWYRPSAYYRAAGWRGTWRGEGGAVLMNQGPHPLDLFCYLAGPPARVTGWIRTRYHAIEAEDTAQAMVEYPNGAPGYLAMSTAETGLTRRLEIVGENGALELAGDQLTVTRLTPDMPEHMATATGMFEAPAAQVETITLPGDGGGHLAVYRDLYRAIVEGGRPRCDGRDGAMSLELANAIILSSFEERTVRLPLDRAAYVALLADLQAGKRRIRE
ncbi:MAG: Gfo/Idh/MocA family oxidoreductase [Anaerolineae bacterium]|nr:Gfo/Idh/MocA family oxidoreductase [Anaerolineae bacterium]